MITIRNDYHNTAARIRATVGDTLTASQITHCRRVLCGIDGCTCGGALSERGQQQDDNGQAFDVIATGLDTVRIEGVSS